jgi:hypothetical protein
MVSKVSFHRDSFTAEMTRNLLEENGLRPMKLVYSNHVFLAGADQGYFVEVPVQEVDIAKKILSENNLGKYVIT